MNQGLYECVICGVVKTKADPSDGCGACGGKVIPVPEVLSPAVGAAGSEAAQDPPVPAESRNATYREGKTDFGGGV